MKKFAFLSWAVVAALFFTACGSSPKGYSVVDGVIVFDAGISFSYKKFLAMDDRHIHSQGKQGFS